jgi:predicted GNAT family acetyltransferase
MEFDAEKLEVVHAPEARRFQIEVEKYMAVLEYVMRGEKMVFTHTGVPRPLEARGVGSRLAKAGLAYAREQGFRVVPACEFMEVYMRRHKEYQDLLAD